MSQQLLNSEEIVIPDISNLVIELETAKIEGIICLITNVLGYTLLVFKDRHGYQIDAIPPKGDRYCLGEIFYSAASAEAKARKWIEDLREEDDEWELDSDE